MRLLDMISPSAQLISSCVLGVGCTAAKIAAPLPPGTRIGHYVTVQGTSAGDGTSERPWDLQTALLGANGRVQPGDTIWLRSGTYSGTFSSTLSGSDGRLTVVRAYPGERAIIDGGTGGPNRIETLTISGQFAVYWGLEVMQSSTARMGESGTGTPLRPAGVYVQSSAHDLKFVNLIIHDVGHGFSTENTAHNIEIYGCIIYNGGHENARTGGRSDGHGIYIKNDGIGWKVARDNVIFNQFGFGIHAYAEGGQGLKNLVLDGNAVFNSGTPSDYDNPNLLLGGTAVADNDSVTNNSLFFSAGAGFWNMRIGYSSTANGVAVVKGNVIAGGSETFELGYWSQLTIQDNTVQSSDRVIAQTDANTTTTQHWTGNIHYRDPAATAWRLNGTNHTFNGWSTAMGASDNASATLPPTAQVIVRPNRYETGRAHIVVYNWALLGSVTVPVSNVLSPGDPYVLRNVQNLFGNPVATGTYQGGGSISVPMPGVTPPQPIGGAFHPLHRTGPEFDVFLLTRP